MKTRRHVRPPSALVPMLLCGFLGASVMVNVAMANTVPRMVLTKPAGGGGAHQHHHGHQTQSQQQAQPQPRRRGGPKKLQLVNGEGASVVLWRPDLSTDSLVIGQDGTVQFKPKVDNYHVVVAERKLEGVKQASIRYEYMRGKPSDQSPSKLAAAQKTDFEIEPAPIPREHHRYMANHVWDFILRFQGKPVSGATAVLETRQGSRVEAVSGADGVASFTIPDDFSEVKPGRRNNKPSEFTLTARHEVAGETYETVLSAPYYVDPAHWKSQGMGLFFAGLGLLAGGLIGAMGKRNGGKGK